MLSHMTIEFTETIEGTRNEIFQLQMVKLGFRETETGTDKQKEKERDHIVSTRVDCNIPYTFFIDKLLIN